MIALLWPLPILILTDIVEVIGIVYFWTDGTSITGKMMAQYVALGMLIPQIPLCLYGLKLSKNSKRVWVRRLYIGQIIFSLALFTITSINWRKWPTWFV